MPRTISTVYQATLSLTARASDPLLIDPGAGVRAAAGNALQSNLPIDWTISNQGSLLATGTVAGGDDGLALAAGASLTNASLAQIGGYGFGVSIASAGTVVNDGLIDAAQTAGSGYLYNGSTHQFSALTAGVFLGGGRLTNDGSGLIEGAFQGVVLDGAGSVENRGKIRGVGAAKGIGIVLSAGGNVTNATGAEIYGTAYAVLGFAAVSIDNQSAGNITSASLGIFGVTGNETVTNQGAIQGTKIAGIDLAGGGQVYNGGSGSISGGYYGVRVAGANSGVTNNGTIRGLASVPTSSSYYQRPISFNGVFLPAGGTVSNSVGALISGGSYGVQITAAGGTVTNGGVISSPRKFGGAGIDLQAGGAVTNSAGGTIAGAWIGVQVGQATTNSGGTIVNEGTIFASDGTNGAAIWIHGPGLIINAASATIAGGALGGVANGPFGIVAYYQTTVINRGSIGGTAFAFDAVRAGVGNLIEMAPGATFGGVVLGAKTSADAHFSTLELLSGTSTGTITGFGTKYQNFGNISIDNAAQWSLGGTVAAGTTIAFAPGGTGSLALTTPRAMGGTITGFGAGETLSLVGITDVTSVSLTSGNVLQVAESTGGGLAIQLDPGQTFTAQTFSQIRTGTTTSITVGESVLGTQIGNAGAAVLRNQPTVALVNQIFTAIIAGQTTLAQFEVGLVRSAQALYTTLPALVTINAYYNATPQSSTLTAVAAATGSPAQVGGFYSAAYLQGLGYSVENVWTIMASEWGADQGSAFYQTYFQPYVSAGIDYSGFISAVYQREFGFAPSAANLANLLSDVQGVQTLLAGPGGSATPIQIVSGIYGYLLYVGQTTPSLTTQYGTAATAFLLAAANGSALYGPELTAQFPSDVAVSAAAADQASATVTSFTVSDTAAAVTAGAAGLQADTKLTALTVAGTAGGDVLNLSGFSIPATINLNGDTASASSGLNAASLTFISTPDAVTLGTGAASIQFTLQPAGGIETIANFQYGLDQLTLNLNGADSTVLTAYDTTINGVHAIALASSADLTHGVVLTGLSSGLTAANLMTSHVTLSGGQATIT